MSPIVDYKYALSGKAETDGLTIIFPKRKADKQVNTFLRIIQPFAASSASEAVSCLLRMIPMIPAMMQITPDAVR